MSATDTTTAQNPLTDLTGFQRDLLVAINDVCDEQTDYPAPSGQNIKLRAEETGYDNLNNGRLYPNLDELVEQGLVEKGEFDRRTNTYRLTAEGEQELESYAGFVGGE